MNRIALLILIAAVLITAISWGAAKFKQPTPETAANKLMEIDQPLPNLEIINAVWVETRIVVQTEFVGTEAQAPASAPEWHDLAAASAEQVYRVIEGRYPIELQLFQSGEFRAVAVAGL